MGTLATALKLRETLRQEQERMARMGLTEGSFLGCLPNAKIAEFKKATTGEIVEAHVPGLTTLAQSLRGQPCYVRLCPLKDERGLKEISEIALSALQDKGW